MVAQAVTGYLGRRWWEARKSNEYSDITPFR